MTEIQIKTQIETFKEKYLKGSHALEAEVLMGFVVLDQSSGIIAAATYDPNYVTVGSDPIKKWVIYKVGNTIRAFVTDKPGDFQNFVMAQVQKQYKNA